MVGTMTDDEKRQLKLARINIDKLINRVKYLEKELMKNGIHISKEPEYYIDNGFPIA
jgi:hypothetical protein